METLSKQVGAFQSKKSFIGSPKAHQMLTLSSKKQSTLLWQIRIKNGKPAFLNLQQLAPLWKFSMIFYPKVLKKPAINCYFEDYKITTI